MKRFLGILFAVVAVAIVVVSCRKVVRSDVHAVVDELTDSVMVCKIDGDKKVKFDITEAKFTNGAIMYGDSVIVNYIGDLDEKRAFAETVYLIVRPSATIPMEVDSTKELITRPADAEKVKQTKEGIEAARQHFKK